MDRLLTCVRLAPPWGGAEARPRSVCVGCSALRSHAWLGRKWPSSADVPAGLARLVTGVAGPWAAPARRRRASTSGRIRRQSSREPARSVCSTARRADGSTPVHSAGGRDHPACVRPDENAAQRACRWAHRRTAPCGWFDGPVIDRLLLVFRSRRLEEGLRPSLGDNLLARVVQLPAPTLLRDGSVREVQIQPQGSPGWSQVLPAHRLSRPGGAEHPRASASAASPPVSRRTGWRPSVRQPRSPSIRPGPATCFHPGESERNAGGRPGVCV